MKIFTAGDELLASELNEVVDSIERSQNNILQLYMENYFASKKTPYLGLLFDGFSDSLKKHIGSGTIVSGVSGQKNVDLSSLGEVQSFAVGDKIHLYNVTYQELHEVETNLGSVAVDDSLDSTASTLTYTDSGNGVPSDGGVVSGKRTVYANKGFAQYYGHWVKLKKTIATVSGVTYTIKVKLTGNLVNNYTNSYLQGEVYAGGVQKYVKLWGYGENDLEVQVEVTFVGTGSNVEIEVRWTNTCNGLYQTYTNEFQGRTRDFQVYHNAFRLTTVSNLTNTLTGGTAKGTSSTIDTGNMQILMTASVGDLRQTIYQALPTTFPTDMSSLGLWLIRAVTVKKAVKTTIAQGATSVTVTATSGTFLAGDTIELKSNDLKVRERKVLTTVTVSGGDLILDFAAQAVVYSGGFTTSDWVERVDALPEISLTNSGSTWVSPTFITATELTVDTVTRTEDSYRYIPATAGKILKAIIKLTRSDTSMTPSAKRFGITVNRDY